METARPATALHGDPPAAASAQGIADRRELAFISVERTRMPMIVTDPRQPGNPIVLANAACLKLTGYSADEMIGHNPRMMQGSQTDPRELKKVRDAIAGEREVVVEMINYRKDRSTFWNQLFVSPVHDDDGKLVYFFGSFLDVSSRREAQALELAEHRLLKEIDHRAKNVLAIVQGIVRLSCADNPARYSRAIQRRVDVLARAHCLLADRGWQDVPLSRLISSEIATVGSGAIDCAGPDFYLPAGKVQPFALMLHELAVNALEHGALSAGGALSIGWDVREDGGELAVRWLERGGPSPAEQRRPGFGLTMIRSIGERQLGGRVELDFDRQGLRAAISLPLHGRA